MADINRTRIFQTGHRKKDLNVKHDGVRRDPWLNLRVQGSPVTPIRKASGGDGTLGHIFFRASTSIWLGVF